MTRKPKSSTNTKPDKNKVELSAKAEATLKAGYTVDKKITQLIPEDVTRAKAGAWLTIISPLTEWAGLKGDALHYKRDKIRIEREATLKIIAEKAANQLSTMPSSQNIPNNFLVPFIEMASLEAPDSKLVDLWANLLVSSSQSFDSRYISYSRIISSISSKHAELFQEVFRTDNMHSLEMAKDYVNNSLSFSRVKLTLKRIIESNTKKDDSDDVIMSAIEQLVDTPGISFVHCSFENIATEAYSDLSFDFATYQDDDEADYSILESHSLIKKVEFGFEDILHWSVAIIYYHITPLGFHFAKACKMLPDPDVD